MDIKKVERFHCHICDYITESDYTIALIKKTGNCPACNNGKHSVWESRKTELEKQIKNLDLSKHGSVQGRNNHLINIIDSFKGYRIIANTVRLNEDIDTPHK
jgi:uncharacterized Fe-S cluster-containing protein